jgi:hypothetical protein
MPEPLAICIEDLDPRTPGDRYLRCVAIVGRRPGLRVDRTGRVLWESDEAVACELWVSADDRLILYRPEGAAAVVCRREGRSLAVPAAKPIVLLDQDRIDVGTRRLRVHVHGTAPAVVPPSLLPVRSGTGAGRVAAAAAIALGAAVGAADCKKVGEQPGVEEARTPPPGVPAARDAAPAGEQDAGAMEAVAPDAVPIEVREYPPDMAAPEELKTLAAPKSDAAATDAGTTENGDAAAEEPAEAAAADAVAPADAGAEDAKARDGRRHREPQPIEVRPNPPDMMLDE